jgi:hypothetical protein
VRTLSIHFGTFWTGIGLTPIGLEWPCSYFSGHMLDNSGYMSYTIRVDMLLGIDMPWSFPITLLR